MVGHWEEAPSAIVLNDRNWRSHPKAQRQALASDPDQVGWCTILVNGRTGRLVDGHLRVDLAMERGEATVPVSYVDLSPEEESLVLASLDPLAAMVGVDDDKLRALLAEVAQATHRKLRANDRPLTNDFVTDDEFTALLAAWFGNASGALRPRPPIRLHVRSSRDHP